MNVFLAGFENIETIEPMVRTRPLFVLGSFYYLKKIRSDVLEMYMTYVTQEANDFILDSGAFSMISGVKGNFLEKLNEYIDEYIAFINKYNIKHFIELDIDKLIGYEKVKEIRERIEKGTNKKCIPVWHMSRGIEEYKKLCQDYEYIAIGGIAIKDIKPKDFNRLFPPLLKIAREYKCKVHGLGFTGKRINDFEFYSVDSSSWINSHRFGQIHSYNYKTNSIKTRKLSDTKRMKNTREVRVRLAEIALKEWKKLQQMFLRK